MFGGGKKDDEEEKGDAQAETQAEPAADETQNQVITMKRGDYMIHIMVEEAKNLLVEPGETVDPMVEVTCLGERKYTTAQTGIDNVGLAVWNEHLFFEPKNMEKEKIEEGKIEIKLMDKGFFKDAIIGFYEFDLSYIYLMKDHAMLHKWVVMSNPESENFGEATGYVKLSITVAAEGDTQVQIDDDPNPNEMDVIQPPQIKPEFYQLVVRFYSAQKLVPMDNGVAFVSKPKIDAYVMLQYKTRKLKTKIVTSEEGATIHWHEEFLIPTQVPIMGGRLLFNVWDDDLSGDEIVGSFTLNAKDIMGKKKGMMFWKNIYGAPLNGSGTHATNMNENPDAASFWKGRILMQVDAYKCDKPVFKKQDVTPELIEVSRPYLIDKTYQIMVQVNSCVALPEEEEEYEVMVRVADHEITTGRPPMVKHNYNRFNFRTTPPGSKDSNKEKDEQVIYKAPYEDVGDMGSVFVYLRHKTMLHGWTNICYLRLKARDLTEKQPGIQWLEFLPDLSIGSVTESHKAGLVGIRICIHDVRAHGEYPWSGVWALRMPKRPKTVKARIYVFQCRDLPAADDDGTSDPYIQIHDSFKSQRTQTIEDNNNPIFYEALELFYEANSIEEMPPFVVDCYDEDPSVIPGKKPSSDFLNRAVIPVSKIRYSESDNVFRPEWFDLKMNAKAPASGQVLLSFAIVEDDFPFKRALDKIHLEEMVEMQEFQLHLNILGLRTLQSPGILPVKKAFINFNLKSLVPPSLGANLPNLKTEPKAPGPDPTINTLMSFNVPLPIDTLFCPRLSCQVYDNVFAGWNQPMIGQFTIPVGDLYIELRNERQTETAALEKVVTQLNRIANGQSVGASFYNLKEKVPVLQNGMEEIEEEIIDTEKQNEADLKAQQMDEKTKKNLNDQLATEDPDFTGSLNASPKAVIDSQPLLEGDSNEEQRLKPVLEEKNKAALHGKLDRITPEEIAEKERLLSQASVNSLATNVIKKHIEEHGDEIPTGRRKSSQSKSILTPRGTVINPKLKKALMAEDQEKEERAKRQGQDKRSRDFEEWKKNAGKNASRNVLMPKYKHDSTLSVDREFDEPPDSIFLGLGWDEDKDTGRRHYRRFYTKELEKVTEICPRESPFNSYDIKRGQSRGAKASIWQIMTGQVKQDASGSVSSEQSMGKFKAIIEVETIQEKKAYVAKKQQLFDDLLKALGNLAESKGIKKFKINLDKLDSQEGREKIELDMEPLGVRHLNITKTLADIQSDEILQRMLLHNMEVIVRCYMISGYDLASRDIGSDSDPYLILQIGHKSFSERDNYQVDERNPGFYKNYDFEQTFPGCPQLVIHAMDYDDLFGDDLIGTTIVDLEDRYFLPEWRALRNPPIEYRSIYHPSSAVSQGVLKMWIEINPAKVPKADEKKLWDIKPKPPYEIEVRLVIWDTKNIKMMDAEGTSDVFIKAFFDNKKALETDTHYRNQDGKASFNYRLKFNEVFPRKDYRLSIQAYDRDFFKSNDIIGSCILDLKQAFTDVELTKRPLGITKPYFDQYMKNDVDPDGKIEFKRDRNTNKDEPSFWLPMESKNEKGEIENCGFVRVQIDIIPKTYAETNPVGAARDDPNVEPFLPPPVGRLFFSLNPCVMYKQLVGPEMRKKICRWTCGILCCALCLALCLYMVPTVLGTLIAGIFSGK